MGLINLHTTNMINTSGFGVSAIQPVRYTAPETANMVQDPNKFTDGVLAAFKVAGEKEKLDAFRHLQEETLALRADRERLSHAAVTTAEAGATKEKETAQAYIDRMNAESKATVAKSNLTSAQDTFSGSEPMLDYWKTAAKATAEGGAKIAPWKAQLEFLKTENDTNAAQREKARSGNVESAKDYAAMVQESKDKWLYDNQGTSEAIAYQKLQYEAAHTTDKLEAEAAAAKADLIYRQAMTKHANAQSEQAGAMARLYDFKATLGYDTPEKLESSLTKLDKRIIDLNREPLSNGFTLTQWKMQNAQNPIDEADIPLDVKQALALEKTYKEQQRELGNQAVQSRHDAHDKHLQMLETKNPVNIKFNQQVGAATPDSVLPFAITPDLEGQTIVGPPGPDGITPRYFIKSGQAIQI